uniref:(California timema) hypothetical protein n=1 Tax=Timema californicum TaxID=61474 RepID=A0A7R9J184_TIMCA|nr:unnamed protein product [Timema californicum]
MFKCLRLNMTSPPQESFTSLISKLSKGQLEIGLILITLNQNNKDRVGLTVPVLHRRRGIMVTSDANHKSTALVRRGVMVTSDINHKSTALARRGVMVTSDVNHKSTALARRGVMVTSDINHKFTALVSRGVMVTSDINHKFTALSKRGIMVTSDVNHKFTALYINHKSTALARRGVIVTSDINHKSTALARRGVIVTSDINHKSTKPQIYTSGPTRGNGHFSISTTNIHLWPDEGISTTNLQLWQSTALARRGVVVTSDINHKSTALARRGVVVTSDINHKSTALVRRGVVVTSDINHKSTALVSRGVMVTSDVNHKSTALVSRAVMVNSDINHKSTARQVNVYVLTPERVDADWLLYLDPFSGSLWVAFVIVAILVTVSLDTILRVSRSLRMEDTTPYSQWDMHFYVFSAFCQQGLLLGYSLALSSNAARLVMFTAYLTGIVLLNAYSGALVSFFSSKELSLPFNSLEDAIKKANMQFGVSAGSQEYRLLDVGLSNQSKHDVRNVFFANLKKDPSLIVIDALSGLSRACATTSFGFLLSSDVASGYLDNAKCKLTALPQTFYQYSMVIPIRRDSPYLGLINHNLNMLRDGGLTSHLSKLSWPVRKKAKLEEQWSSVDLQDVRPVLAILGIGGALAGMFFFLEVKRSRITSRRDSKPSHVNTRR